MDNLHSTIEHDRPAHHFESSHYPVKHAVNQPIAGYKHVTCRHCSFSPLCLQNAVSSCKAPDLARRIFKRGQNIFSPGDSLEYFAIVREGAVKCFSLNSDGSEQITRFALPGDILGLEAYASGEQQNFAQAIELSEVCLFSISQIQTQWCNNPSFQMHCMKLMSCSLAKQAHISRLLNKTSADTRLAAFLLEIVQNCKARQLRHDEIRLPMPRSDIGNYLSLALETISRAMSRFEKWGLIHVTGKHVKILDLPGLEALLPETTLL